MYRFSARCIITAAPQAADKAKFAEMGHVMVENCVESSNVRNWILDIVKNQDNLDVIPFKVNDELRSLDRCATVNKELRKFYDNDLREWVEDLTDEPMCLYRDILIFKSPLQPRSAKHSIREFHGLLNLDKVLCVAMGIYRDAEFAVSCVVGENEKFYPQGPLDLVVYDQDVLLINEENKTKDQLIGALILYSRKLDGDNYEKFYEARQNALKNK